jgi:hypothetical protein
VVCVCTCSVGWQLDRLRRQENDQLLEIEMRSDIVLCQAVTTLVTCFVRKLRLVQRYMSPAAGRRLLSQYHQVGYFVRPLAWSPSGFATVLLSRECVWVLGVVLDADWV